jgi:RNA polymerase-binding transcription factor DksA
MKKGARLCSVCGRAIPLARIKILPGTTTCVKCATVERYSSLDIPDYAFAQPPDGARIEDEEES